MNDIIRFNNLSVYPTIAHGVSTKAYGSMKKEDGSVHYANLLKFAKSSGVNKVTICMNQVHSGNVAIVENDRELVIPKVDALVTRNKEISLAVRTADCLPILLYDPVNDVIAAAHAGSKGLLKNIIGNTIKVMKESFDTKPEDLIVGIGPSIEQQCYVVGKELIQLYRTAFPDFNSVYIEGNGTFFLDIRSVAVQDLRREGVLKENIEVSKICTKCNPEFLYSYRNGDEVGRFASVIGYK